IAGVAGLGPDVAALRASLVGAGLVLVAWNALLLRARWSRARGLAYTVELRPQHYMQVLVQASIYAYWGWQLTIPLVRDHIPLLLAQIAFAYGFDLLLSWTRRGHYTLGFGPGPVVLSINLFLWFKPEYFYLQWVLVAAGFTAKELLRWTREGRKVHIFNPSSFPLAIMSIGLIAFGATNISWGPLIAQTESVPPNMFLLLFVLALPAQLLFGVSATAMAAAVTTYLLGQLFLHVTGTYFFLDTAIPVPVFIGMLLLVTDPATSPRTELGRIIFGALYGVTTMILYQVLLSADVPSFYDKLLQVPLLNLSVRAFDRWATGPLSVIDPQKLGRGLHPRWRYVAYTGVWCAAFAWMTGTRALGDHHPGQFWPYWIGKCEEGNARACAYLAVVDQQMCGVGSGWACNEAGVLGARSSWGLSARADVTRRANLFRAGCDRGFRPACDNHVHYIGAPIDFERGDPTPADYQVLLRGSRRWSIPASTPAQLYARACAQGWPHTCELAGGTTSPP
ncbi:MAG TPA: hypothetical protein VHE35_14085, partial [Kofleriaceae bacterium]|nr:hypothetical protein [Kofleriaceae bacterium]